MNIDTSKKKYGKFYTPKNYASFLVKLILKTYLKESGSKEIKILDPACGDGIFLDEIIDNISIYFEKTGINKVSLFGIDIDKEAIEIAKINLNKKRNDKINLNLINTDAILEQSELLDSTTITRIFTQKYDIIIGNPPWVSIKGKYREDLYSAKQLKYILERYPCDKYRPNTAEIFIWRSFELLKDGGFLAFIVPDRIFKNSQFSKLRKEIFYKYKLEYLITNVPFKYVNSDNIIFIIRKIIPDKNHKIKIKSFDSNKWMNIPKEDFFDEGFSCNFLEKKNVNIIKKIESLPNVKKLKEYFYTGVGFICNKNKITTEQVNSKQSPIVLGRDIGKNRINNVRYFDFNKKNLLGGTQNIDILSKRPKILLRKTGSSLIPVIDTKGYLPEQSLYFIFPRNNDQNELYFLNRLLNSNILKFYYLAKAITNIDSIPQLKKADLDNFPILLFSYAKDIISQKIWESGNTQNLKFKNITEQDIYKLYGITQKEAIIIENFISENS